MPKNHGPRPGGRPRRPDAERRLRQAARFARVLRLLELLQGRAGLDLAALASELEVSTRTVRRDLEVLALAGVPWTRDPRRGLYEVAPGWRFAVPDLTDAERVGLATAAALTDAPGLDVDAGAGPALRRVIASSRPATRALLAEARRVVEVLGLHLADHAGRRSAIAAVQEALLAGRRLAGTYVSPHLPGPRHLVLHPYRLCLVGRAWYVVGRAEGATGPATYRVARFRSLTALDEPAEVPVAFDLRAYFGDAWAVYRGDRSFEIEVRFLPGAAELALETTWHPTQRAERHADGSATLSFRVDGLEEVLWWVLGWGGRALVVRPEELRERARAQWRLALELNG